MHIMRRKNGIISGVIVIFTLAVAIFLISCSGVIPYCTVTFVNGDETVHTETVLNGGRVSFPEIEMPLGYEAEWLCEDGTVFSEADTVTGNLRLTLSQKPIEYTVTYQLGGGIAPDGNPEKLTVENEAFTLLPATREGAAFEGWQDADGNSVTVLNSDCIPTDGGSREIILTAKWRVTTFTVTYDSVGGSLPDNPDTYTVDDSNVFLLPSELRGYTFLGWFNGAGEKVLSFAGQVGELHLTARWEITRFPIVYNVGKNTDNTVNPTEFTFLDSVEIHAPSRYGFDFVGWLVGDALEPVASYVIPTDTAEPVRLTAVWSAHSARLTVMNGSEIYAEIDTEFGESFSLDELSERRDGYAVTVFFDYQRNEPVTLPYEIDGYSVELFVFYTPIEYLVTLDYGDGNAVNYRVFTVEDAGFTLPAPEREGFTFKGWSDGADSYSEITAGSFGNKELTAVWKRNSYPLIFDTMGGTPVSSIQIEYGAKITFNVNTTKQDMVFGGWYMDEGYESPFIGGTMPAERVTLYARWFQNASYAVNYQSTPAGVPLSGSCISGAAIMDGKEATLNAPEYYNGMLFTEWTVNGVSCGKNREISVLVDGGEINAVAHYRAVHGYDYDISASGDLVIPTFASDAYLDGHRIMSEHQTLKGGALTVREDYLDSLGIGLRVFAFTENGSVSFVYINITDSAARPSVKVDFDSEFPNAVLTCDIPEGQEFVYSVNGGTPKAFSGRAVISGINRSRDNVFTVSPVGGGESYTKTVKAINSKYAEYYNGSFNYGGRTYDLVVNSEEELTALIEYICFVMVVTDAEYDSENESYAVALTYIIGEDYAEEFNADKALAYGRIFERISIPYSPAYSTSSFGESSPKGKVTVWFNELNTVLSGQNKIELPDNFGALNDSDRPENFDGFYIDSLETTQLVRSIYELEALPFGVRPLFDSSEGSQLAKRVYDAARQALRKHVSDGMSDYEKAAAIYGYLGLNVTYDKALAQLGGATGKYRGFTSYGALIDGVAVCDGYASAYRIMCLIEGIPCLEIIGTSNGVGHAWNKILIDGAWYGVDSTWSRVNNEKITFRYLLINEAQLIEGGHRENHIIPTVDNPVPNEEYIDVVASSDKDFYSISGRVITQAADIKVLVDNAVKNGVTVLELRNLSGSSIGELFKGYKLSDFDVEGLSYAAEQGTDIVYIMLEL